LEKEKWVKVGGWLGKKRKREGGREGGRERRKKWKI